MPKKPIKPFITYSDQINILTQKKQLNISDLSYAEGKLHDIGYYSLIDGYKDIFYNPMTRTYVKGTDFADIVALYEFDENLRSLVFKYICHIEQKIRSLISYSFCEAFSENQSAYLNSANYNVSNKNSGDISKLISILTYEANQNTEHSYVVYQRNTYGNVPLWVIMKTLTLGQTSKMYSFMLPSIKSKVSVHYGNISEKELIQYLKVLTVFRNICAHNERLFSFETRFEIPNTMNFLICRLTLRTRYIQLIQFKFHLNIIIRLPLRQKRHRLHIRRSREHVHTTCFFHFIASFQKCIQISGKAGWLAGNINDVRNSIV